MSTSQSDAADDAKLAAEIARKMEKLPDARRYEVQNLRKAGIARRAQEQAERNAQTQQQSFRADDLEEVATVRLESKPNRPTRAERPQGSLRKGSSNPLAAWQPRHQKQPSKSAGASPSRTPTTEVEEAHGTGRPIKKAKISDAQVKTQANTKSPARSVTPLNGTAPALAVPEVRDKTVQDSTVMETPSERNKTVQDNVAMKTSQRAVPTSAFANERRSKGKEPKQAAAAVATAMTAKPTAGPSTEPAKWTSELPPSMTANRTASITSNSAMLAALKIPKKSKTLPSPLSASGSNGDSSGELDERPPKWYKDMKVPQTRSKGQSSADTLLNRLKSSIAQCKKNPSSKKVIDDLREQLHSAPFEKITTELVRAHRMLHNEDGLPQIFDSEVTPLAHGVLPYDVRADAEELYNKWCRRMFDTDINHHIQYKNAQHGDRVDPSYKHRVDAHYRGNGLLLNGQWFPSQLAAFRDGAHGGIIAGITGTRGQGVFSCIISAGTGYDNIDKGDVVLYCGTDPDLGGDTSDHTKLMLESEQNGEPVRFLRSHASPGTWAPAAGCRYDGLYTVAGHEMLDTALSIGKRHRFRLERVPGQDPIRGGNGPEARPTRQELHASKEDKKMRAGR